MHREEIGIPTRLSDIFWAHSLPNRPLDEWQRLDDHLNAVAKSAAIFAEAFGSSTWAWNAGMLHDFGKALDGFQAYIRRENDIDDPLYDETGLGRVNHSSAGAALAEEFLSTPTAPFGRILAYIVAGHHAGLPDYDACDGGMAALPKRLQEGARDLAALRSVVEVIRASINFDAKLPAFVNKTNFHMWTRMIFSCLVDADFLDTESFMNAEQSKLRQPGESLVALKHALDRHMNTMVEKAEGSAVNIVRREILVACRVAAKSESGLFTLTVPTGGGKTLAAMSFALDHAVKWNKRRIIYVIPYTSIIEQTSNILADIFGQENVVEHHSNLDPDRETIRSRLASENWDAPIVVTTNVQFFESLYAAKPGRCRKLHNLVNSVVILDEAQLVEPTLLTPCVGALNEVVRNYGVTLVLSTATQPALPKIGRYTEIIPRELELYKRLHRTDIKFPDDLSVRNTWTDIAEELEQYEQVLCIVNARRDCYELYQLMPPGTIHLSALMCGEHRTAVIKEIKSRLKKGEPIRVISTQLVEAGVDIDFPVVYRALAGLDSIVQAAGRCNREGKLDIGRVCVFVPPESPYSALLRKGEVTTRELHAISQFDSQSPDTFTKYFELFYSKLNDTGQSFIDNLTPSKPSILDIAFRTVGTEFRLIRDEYSRPVFVRYGKGNELITSLRHAGPNNSLLRKLQRFTVSLPVKLADRLLRDGQLEEVLPGFIAQCSPSLYTNELGLDVFRDHVPANEMMF